jgi:hypothetical protein
MAPTFHKWRLCLQSLLEAACAQGLFAPRDPGGHFKGRPPTQDCHLMGELEREGKKTHGVEWGLEHKERLGCVASAGDLGVPGVEDPPDHSGARGGRGAAWRNGGPGQQSDTGFRVGSGCVGLVSCCTPVETGCIAVGVLVRGRGTAPVVSQQHASP